MVRIGIFYFGVLFLFIAGCDVEPSSNRSYVAKGIKERTAFELGQAEEPGTFNLPEGISLEDGLSEDEAVAIALWNNAQFQADLTTLGFARADLLEANMLSNPVFSILFPVSPKLLETALDIPVDVLWQRPHRITSAELDAQKLSENLIRNGLGLVRDVQIIHAELASAREQVILAAKEAELQTQINQLHQTLLTTGSISELAATGSRVDTFRAADTAKRISQEADILEQRLNTLLGISSNEITFDIVTLDIPPAFVESVDELLKTAFVCRPDLRAAELEIEAAGERIGWEKSKVYTFIAVLDGDDTEDDSFTIRPGFSVEIPIFNQNDAGIERAKAELEKAAREYEAVRQNIIGEVKQAYSRYVSAYEQTNLWRDDIIPSLEEAFEQIKKAYKAGDVSLISVLRAQSELLQARMHQTELNARLKSSVAELNYCIGKKVI